MSEISIVKRFAEPLYRVKKWIKFVAIFSIIYGVLVIFSGFGILICWIPIWMGTSLLSALKRLEIAFETNNENELQISLNKLSKYFKICGIFLLVLLIIIIIGIIAAIAVPAFLPANEALVGT